ncbi:IF-2B-domain-containing protein [Acrodontium crateriforme]|uniref:Translation initiation factor eIF2B subunit delta n=1 Tax=Acrodontium crateriforme TaxID=150365 RepID=A0AAQ3R8N6_9PEZI|nr:IF-2B-domain-containing protein [Acrodontium crateriforme]
MSAPAPPSTEPAKPDEAKLSPAELKKRAKAEKQARRAAIKGDQPGGESSTSGGNGESGAQAANAIGGPPQKKPQQQKAGQQKQGRQGNQDARGAQGDRGASQQQALPLRRRGSQSGLATADSKKDNKQVELFSHLYTQPRRHTVEGTSKDVHPAVLALGFQFSSYEICGSSARCVAMLLAFKEAIQSYTTPTGTSLPRHLTSHFLSPQIEFLKSCRSISESMGNAIRYLKKIIVEIDPNMPEQEAKAYLCEEMDRFIRERITITDQAIAASACLQIKNGSTVLTYAKSSIVEKTILQAHANGTKFRVIIVDSRPLFEGKHLASSLMSAGLQVEYLPYSGIPHAIKSASLVLLGAHSMLSNGRLQSRVGTASLAMQAQKADIPVIVCCESVKFSGKVALDNIVLNEVAPPEELIPLAPATGPMTADDKAGEDDEERSKVKTLSEWRDIPNLQILNLMYDITPAEYIRMVICEYGSVPPSSVPVVHRLANEGM